MRWTLTVFETFLTFIKHGQLLRNLKTYHAIETPGQAVLWLYREVFYNLKISDNGILGFSVLCEGFFVLVRQVCLDLVDGF